ncbi:uncharacterized protein LOC135393407 [Ornithodoros turicata]|uniref:uncharacterized protein LOC135393407 n=1 Tax=Ornithodoros turicata TaxID=34597 RepID=UPI003139D040
MFYGHMLGALFLQTFVFSAWILKSCDGSADKGSRAKEPDLPEHARLGVFMIIDPSIGNATREGYINYTASLLGGVNIKFRNIKSRTIKLGLVDLHIMNETEVSTYLPVNNNSHLELRSTWQALLKFKATMTPANETDILYVLTGRNIFSTTEWPKVLSGAASTKGVCTDYNIAVGNDVLGSYLGMDVFALNMARMLGAWSHECYKNFSGVFDDCHEKHLMSTLRRAWPYCTQHNTIITTWMSGGQLPGEFFNNSAYCEGKGNNTVQLKECEVSKNKTQECLLCCSLATDPNNVSYYDAPDGTTCIDNLYDSEKIGCLEKKCETRLWKIKRVANPAWSYPVNLKETTTATTTSG